MAITQNQSYLTLNNEMLSTYKTSGFLDLDKDKEATRRFFLENINKKMRHFIDTQDKIDYLIEEGYYEKEFFDDYDMDFVISLYEKAYKYSFRFPSFMSASKFYDSYALKSRDDSEILEKYEDRMVIIALYVARGNEKDAENFLDAIMTSFQPATPTALNSGKKARGELVSCYKLSMDDSMNSISANIGYCLELSRLGGGVGVNLTDVRPLGDPIKGIENRASGIIPVAKLLENAFSYSNQLGQRNGSGVVYLNVFHADIEEFISSKKANADEKTRLATLSTGIVIPDIFFKLMEKDKDVVLFSPYDIKNVYGKRMSEIDISEMYYELLSNPKIRNIKRINARKLYTEIKKTQFESGYPFEVYDNNVNDNHALKKLGRIKMSNLCTEILQLQRTSIITDQNQENLYGLDVSCNLGSLDIYRSTKVSSFANLVNSAVRFLSNVSAMTNIVNVPSVVNANNSMHSIGLGAMNLHGHLMDNDILYGSKDSIDFTDHYFEALNYYSLWASMELAKERGTFEGFEYSEYASGNYFDKYISKENVIPNEKVQSALGNIPIVTSQMWKKLKKEVMKYGVHNSYRLAIAPTGSISYVRSCTASIAPVTEKIEIRDYADSRTIYPMPFLTNENQFKYVEAYEMDQYDMVDLYAAAQKHIDQGISMTLYITDDWDTEKLTKLYYYSWSKGIKSIYYVRQKMQTIKECASCQI